MNNFGFCHLSVIPVRSSASDLADMTTQLLFGDVFEILESQDNWLHINNAFDDYQGWIDNKQQLPIGFEEFQKFKSADYTNKSGGLIYANNEPLNLVSASSFYSNKTFSIGNYTFKTEIELIKNTKKNLNSIALIAKSFLNAPYLWGGKTLYGIDCSGFSQNVYKLAGIKLKRDASEQANQGETLGFLGEAKTGDLLFFDNEEGKIIHVGIFLGDSKIIHASGKVRIDSIDHHGIFNIELKRYTHQLRLIKTHS